ncbi:MAG TPA: ATP synthase F0 subunit B [Candidatus Binatia bacterium]|nr:ATP synthase F0 subunit B [Candidatus Binatia bacterium]
MIHIDPTVVIQIILFLGLWYALNNLLFRPYLRLLEEREGRTEGVRRETADLEREGQRLRDEYEERIAEARESGRVAKERILDQAREQRERLLSGAREEAANILERVRGEIRSQLQKEGVIAATEATPIAQAMANKILGRRVG